MFCDVVVVGGGPAGLATAIEATRRGLSTYVFERAAGPPESPGETLHPKVASVLHHLGVERTIADQCFGRIGGIWVSSPGAPPLYQAFDPSLGLGYHVRRSILNGALGNRALSLGAQVTYGAVVQKMDFVADNVCLDIRVSDDMPTQLLTARCLIDATGKAGWSARRLKTKPAYRSEPISLRYGWKRVHCKQNFDPLFIQRGHRWIWQAHLGDGRLAWVERGGENRVGRGADGTWFLSSRAVEDKVIRVGDAACRLDPSIGHGVARALLSGVSAAGIAAEICSSRGLNSEALRPLRNQYCDWITDSFVQDTKFISQNSTQ